MRTISDLAACAWAASADAMHCKLNTWNYEHCFSDGSTEAATQATLRRQQHMWLCRTYEDKSSERQVESCLEDMAKCRGMMVPQECIHD